MHPTVTRAPYGYDMATFALNGGTRQSSCSSQGDANWMNQPTLGSDSLFSGEVGKQLVCYLFLVATRSGGAMTKVVRRSKI